MVRQLNSGRSKIQDGGGRSQPQQDPGHRDPQQLQGVRGRLAVPARLAHEPGAQMRAVVIPKTDEVTILDTCDCFRTRFEIVIRVSNSNSARLYQ